MIVAVQLAQAMQESGMGTLGEDIFIGRIPTDYGEKAWAIQAVPGEGLFGGNIGQFKLRSNFVVTHQNTNPEEIYELEDKLRSVLSVIPHFDPRFYRVSVGTLDDQGIPVNERRAGAWSVETITVADATEGES